MSKEKGKRGKEKRGGGVRWRSELRHPFHRRLATTGWLRVLSAFVKSRLARELEFQTHHGDGVVRSAFTHGRFFGAGGYCKYFFDVDVRVRRRDSQTRRDRYSARIVWEPRRNDFELRQESTRIEVLGVNRSAKLSEKQLWSKLTAVAEGRPGGANFRRWFKAKRAPLKRMLTPGTYLRLGIMPWTEAGRLLGERGIAFTPSARHAWLDYGTPGGRCRWCRRPLVRRRGGGWRPCARPWEEHR